MSLAHRTYYTAGAAWAHLCAHRAPGTTIYDADTDWDICIILDSARADDMATCWPDGIAAASRRRQWSVGSCTTEWLANTFRPAYRNAIAETTLVTAHPHTETVLGENGWLTNPKPSWLSYPDAPAVDRDAFAAVVDLWRSHATTEAVVPPATMADATIEAHRTTDGRVVAHWLQPHEPFIADAAPVDGTDIDGPIWDALRDGRLPVSDVRSSVRANIRLALREVQRVCTALDATVLVTADHGNAFGEWGGVYGHPFAWPQPTVRRVPWVVVEATATRDVPTPNILNESCVDTPPTDQLRALGYL